MLSIKQLKQQTCRYCHAPYLTLKNGDRLMPPLTIFDYWGIMSH